MRLDAGDFEFRTATAADEADIRHLVGTTAMPGAVSIRFQREPDYFLGCDIMGRVCEVLLARHRDSGELAGIMCRTEDEVYVNGEPQTVGGISQVRIAPKFRGLRLIEMGWPVFSRRDLLYLGVIARGNPAATRTLVERPPGGPRVVRIGGITTLGLPVRRTLRPRRPAAGIAPARTEALAELVGFLNGEGKRRQFAPVRRESDFTDGRRLRGLVLDSVLTATSDGRIVGSLALWDQRGYKQDVVAGYGSALRRWRPLIDLGARALGAAPLPQPGSRLESAFAALPLVAADDPAVFAALLDAVMLRARSRGLEWVTVGFADGDPLLAVARRRLHITYRSDLFCATWAEAPPALDDRVPYVELATF